MTSADAISGSENTLAADLVDRLAPGMLVLADRGFSGFPLWSRAVATGADLLWRAKPAMQPRVTKILSDGSFLAQLRPSGNAGRKAEPLPIRIVEYTIDDGRANDETYRLFTTILDPDDVSAIALARRYLSHFPTNAWQAPPGRGGRDTGPRRLDVLALIPPDPRQPYPIRPVLSELVDDGELLEVQPGHGSSIVTALAHLGGRSVAVVANDPATLAGTIDSAAADKAAHFLDVADAFGLPCLFLADNPGVLAGTAAEGQGILRHAARLFAVQHRMRVPKLHVTLRKAFGFGSSVMAMNPFDGQTVTLALPSITLGALPAASAASAIDDADERARVAAEQSEASVRAAARLSYDDVVDPRDLRDALLSALALTAGREAGARRPRGTGILP